MISYICPKENDPLLVFQGKDKFSKDIETISLYKNSDHTYLENLHLRSLYNKDLGKVEILTVDELATLMTESEMDRYIKEVEFLNGKSLYSPNVIPSIGLPSMIEVITMSGEVIDIYREISEYLNSNVGNWWPISSKEVVLIHTNSGK